MEQKRLLMLMNPLLRWIEKIYNILLKIGSNLQSLFLLYMRVTWGHQLILTGLAKLKDIGAFTQLLIKFHYPAPHFHAYGVAYFEVIAGFLLVVGLFSRLISIPLIFLTLTTLSTIHAATLGNFRFITEPLLLVAQQPYPFLITALLVFIFGPGRISIDALIRHWSTQWQRY